MPRNLVCLSACHILWACVPTSDEGTPCSLIRKDESGRAVPLLERELPAGKDVLSFGSAECAEWVCVREERPPTGSGDSVAVGHCSRPCSVASGCNSVDPAVPLSCRELVLDSRTLAVICASSSEDCLRLGGSGSRFCAAPAAH
ncbi:MAG: adventurous gliding motility lipoprotein CglD [Myxococcales bacterium]|nr:adventurous gliding motility lipoprotein CglD [Myxococcales bacterium]